MPLLVSSKNDSAIVLDIGEKECRVIAIAHGRPILQTLRCKYNT
jgi:hypothetical protein